MQQKLELLLHKGIQQFLELEKTHITTGISERNLCGSLMTQMNQLLPKYDLDEYFVDVEYNRKQGGQVKTIINDEMRVINISCDLIIHSRGNKVKDDNLIAVEMKKSTRPESEKNSDRDRLIAMTSRSYDGVWSNDGNTHPEHVCDYILGAYLEIDVEAKNLFFELYHDGGKYASGDYSFNSDQIED